MIPDVTVDVSDFDLADVRSLLVFLESTEEIQHLGPLAAPQNGTSDLQFGPPMDLMRNIAVYFGPEIHTLAGAGVLVLIAQIKKWWRHLFKSELCEDDYTIIYGPDGKPVLKVKKRNQ